MSENMDERLRELLADQAVFGLSAEESRELSEVSDGGSSSMDALTLELAAAAVLLAETPVEPMPEHLQARVLAAAEQHFADNDIQPTFAPAAVASRPSWFGWLGWAFAAVAITALGLNLVLTRSSSGPIATATPSPTPVVLTPAQQREQLMASPDVARAEWTNGNMPGVEVSGDVVWSDAKQAGYMTFRGLPVNDANTAVYQLWIFDETQSDKTPIDGGVFNVTADGEVIIPIDAKLKARNPKAFAVTMEKPGGVVVSDRKKIAALAPVKPAQT